MANNGQKFQVHLDGIELPDEVVQRIDAAIRKAVLSELATVNLNGRSVDLLRRGFSVAPLGEPGHPQGLQVRKMEA